MKELLAIVIILLLVSVALNVYQGMNARDAQNNYMANNLHHNEVIASKTAVIATRDREIFVRDSLRLSDSLKFRTREIASNREIQAYRQTIAKLRPLVASKIDSFPDLRDFVAAQDSTIERQDSLLRDTEIFCQLQVNDLQAIIQLQNEKYVAQEAISQAWMETAAEAQKQARKEKRKGKFKNVVIGALAGLAVFLAVK